MKGIPVEKVRNVVILGHAKAGKTSLVDALLFRAGVNDRHGVVDQGTSMADYTKEEIARQTTVSAKTFHFQHEGTLFYITDTPGYADFIGEVYAGLRAADVALFVVDGTSGIGVGTQRAWKQALEQHKPRCVVISRLDREHTDFYAQLEKLRAIWGHGVVPLNLPAGAEGRLDGVYDLLSDETPPAELAEQAEAWRETLMESVAESDDALMEKYFESGTLAGEELRQGLRAAVRKGSCVPVFVTVAPKLIGIDELLRGLAAVAPSPGELGPATLLDGKTVEPSAQGPLSAFVYKTLVDDFVGQLTLMRVFSGTLRSDSEIYNASRGQKERIGPLYVPQGKAPAKVEEVGPGEIVAIAKLKSTRVNDSLGDAGSSLKHAPIEFPKPTISFAIHATKQGEEEKIATGLARLADEDPTLRVERNSETRQLVISGMGDVHLDVQVNRLREKSGVQIELSVPQVPYKETTTASSEGHYRHKKQTGGHGQFGEVYCRMEPLPRGSGFEFVDAIVGGAIPRNFVPAVEKGMIEAIDRGCVAGYPVVDVRLTIYDGSYHTVDSSEMAFKIAGRGAFREAMAKAKPVLLEPIMNVAVTVPDEYMGDITGDLNSKRGRIQGMEVADGLQTIRAQVPLAEMFRYSTELRSMTGGRGSFEISFSHYEEVPGNIAQKVVAEAKAREQAEQG